MPALNPFLKQIASWLIKKAGRDLSHYQIVFPNKRAALFFRQYLSELSDKPLWSPEFNDISTFIASFSDLKVINNYELVFDLYEVQNRILTERGLKAEQIDSFYPWANMILSDFNEIDKNLIDASDIFSKLIHIKEGENPLEYLEEEQLEIIRQFWKNIDSSVMSEHKKTFLQIWEMMIPLYEGLHLTLRNKKSAYEGMIYSDVASLAVREGLDNRGKKIIFAGFNLLSKSEIQIFDYFRKSSDCSFFWDADKELQNRENFPIFNIIKRNRQNFPHPEDFQYQEGNQFNNLHISLTGVSLEVGQTKVVGDIISKMEVKEQRSDDIAIVLPAEHLLLPLLHSLPADSVLNISMGYPFKYTYVASFVSLLGNLWINARGKNEQLLHVEDLLMVLKHPLIYMAYPEENESVLMKFASITRRYIRSAHLKDYENIYNLLIENRQTSGNYAGYLMKIVAEFCLITGRSQETKIERELLYAFYKELSRLHECLKGRELNLGDKLFDRLVKEIIHSISLPFSGEPLAGIQVLGVLETRCLDFEQVFVMSVNEGIWPKNTSSSSFIPYNLRRAFNLPTYEQDDAVYAYYFYRLLQRSSHVHLLYNTEIGQNSTGEVSRYVSQLKYDLGLRMVERFLSQSVKPYVAKEIRVQKSSEIIDKLYKRYSVSKDGKILSASALNTYMDCSLKYYFQYIADLKEPDEVEEGLDGRHIGNILHETMEILYDSLMSKNNSKTLNTEILDKAQEQVEKIVKECMLHQLKLSEDEEDYIPGGMELLISKVLENYVEKLLDFDKRYSPFTVISLEGDQGWLGFPLEIDVNGKPLNLMFAGKIDRLDKYENTIRVVDYKTGKDEPRFPNIKSLFDVNLEKRNKAAFQMLFYSLLVSGNVKNDLPIQPALFVLNKMFSESFEWKLAYKDITEAWIPLNDARPFLSEFKSNLILLIKDIFNVENDFAQTPFTYRCSYCSYNTICRR